MIFIKGSLDELESIYEEHEQQQERKESSLEEVLYCIIIVTQCFHSLPPVQCQRRLERLNADEMQLKEKMNKLSEECGRLESEEQVIKNQLCFVPYIFLSLHSAASLSFSLSLSP